MYKAKCNISWENKYFEAGQLYSKSEIKGLPISDFEIVDVEEDVAVEMSMTTASVKPKKAKK